MPSGINEGIKWSMLELRGLVEDEDVRVFYQRAQKHLGLYPFHLKDLNTAIREILNSTINCYDNELQGLVLVYKNPKLLTALGAILHDSHFIHIDVLADFYVFKPEIGCTLKGIINKKAENHVGVLVHKAFNVSIPKPEGSEEWLGDCVYVGQQVKFTVTHLDFKGKLPFIRGILLADGIDVPSCDNPVDSTNGEEYNGDLEQWQDSGTTEIVSETAKKRSKKHSLVVNSSGDDLSDSDNKLKVSKRKAEKNGSVKKEISAKPRIDDESSTDGAEEQMLNSTSTKDRRASGDKRNRKNSRDSSQNNTDVDERTKVSPRKTQLDSSSSDTVDVDEKPEINPRKKRRDSSSRNTIDVDENPKISPRKKQRDLNLGDTTDIDEKPKISPRKKQRDSNLGDTTDIDEKPKISPRKKQRDSNVGDTTDIDEKPKISPRKKQRDSNLGDTTDIDEKPKIGPRKKQRDSNLSDTTDIDEKPKISPRKKKHDSNLSDAIDIDEKPKISSRKSSKEKRTNGEYDATAEETVSKTESRDRKNKTSTASEEKEKRDKKTVDSDEDHAEKVVSPKKHSKKRKMFDSETEEASEFETKPSVRVKKKKKTKVENDEEPVAEPESLPSNGRDFDFVKPDVDTCVPSSVKSKRKRHREVDDKETSESSQTVPINSEQNSSDFFRDVRIKVEPDPSDIEDTVSVKSSAKRKKKRAKTELESGDESFGATRIKIEPDASDLEDARPSKKKSKKKRSSDGETINGIKIKVEPNASDVEGSVVPKLKLKPEPHGFNIKVDKDNDSV